MLLTIKPDSTINQDGDIPSACVRPAKSHSADLLADRKYFRLSQISEWAKGNDVIWFP